MRRRRKVEPGEPEARCLYCDKVTGHPGYWIKTVCGDCVWRSDRDERREVEAGMRPWARPLSFWVSFFKQRPMSDAELAECVAKKAQEPAA